MINRFYFIIQNSKKLIFYADLCADKANRLTEREKKIHFNEDL